ncbi:PREDICTED: uncharacterized protein LOC109587068 [Amphimedon queenslandica]|uniref:Fibronectin type-III domain-containing protein n=1 Tax=Amphimedon queenslandica TaxID=400682 RepID=A0AAN0JPV4_AMPQE|nr:PREDICTED: uncharacterized protein LOC109587068 [Amphimedon queenslandica]|eukprot:XP_019858847.1 PREDICTED: uncharacterized protein LOC109587068 [Amphimedon queenslandica]
MSVKTTFEMVSLCLLVLLMQPSFVSTFGCQHNSCFERISHSYAYNAVKVANESETEYQNFTFPVNATVYATASGNASFYASIPKDYSNHCRLRTFESDCWASKQCHGPNRKILLYEEERQKVIEYKFYNLTVAQDGTRIDICAHCGGPGGSYVCFPPVYLTVNGPPVNLSNYVSVKVTSNGIVITGIIDTDTELLIIIKNTNNETVYEETVHILPFVVSGNKIDSNFDPAANYTVFITGKNPAGTGETLQRSVSFKNFISFNVSSVKYRIVNGRTVAIISLTFNRSRPLSIPRQIKVESDCIHKGHKEVFLNKSDSLRIRLLQGVKDCVLNLSSGGKQKSINIMTLIAAVVAVCVIAAILAIIAIARIIVVLVKKKSKKSEYTVTFSDITVTIEGSEDKKSETEVDIPAPHSVPVRDTESHSEYVQNVHLFDFNLL